MTTLVLLTADTDCDGTSYAAHRIAVPMSRRAEYLRDSEALARYGIMSDQLSSYWDDGYDVLTGQEFTSRYLVNMSSWDVDYWHRHGYTSRHEEARWMPWAHDDTIGIPALDSRFED